jgi:tetratricopeptide (TPR) repeat protein
VCQLGCRPTDSGYLGHSYVADHFQYIPSISILALVAASVTSLVDRLGRWRVHVAVGVMVAVVMVFGSLTWRQNVIYQSKEAFWSYNLEMNPTHTAAGALGDMCLRRGELDHALPLLRRSLALKENERGHFRLGELYTQRKQYDEAVREFEKAIEVNRRKNRIPELESRAYFNLGAIYWRKREYNRCVEVWEKTLALDPDSEKAGEWLEKAKRRVASRETAPRSTEASGETTQ